MDKKRIAEAFTELRSLGYFARQNFKCCCDCGWYGVPIEKIDKAIFYHRQDNNDLIKEGKCYLSWTGNGNEIVLILNKHGIHTEWDGSIDKRIMINLT